MTSDSHHFDRRVSDVNAGALSLRVGALEARMETVERDLKDNARELRANTVLTQQVHKNTEDIVEAMQSLAAMWAFLARWARRLAIFSKYATYVVGLGVAVLTALHLRK